MFGYEYMEETEDFQFNELNIYFFLFGISYRWRNDGEDIQNLDI